MSAKAGYAGAASPRAGRRHPAAEETRTKFERKVELLERWAQAGGAPEGVAWPRGAVALARWADEGLGLRAWSSPNVCSPRGPYADLRARFDAAVRALGTAGEPSNRSDAARRIRDLKAHVTALREQVLTLRCGLRECEAALARTSDLLAEAQAREAGLRADLARVAPLRVVGP